MRTTPIFPALATALITAVAACGPSPSIDYTHSPRTSPPAPTEGDALGRITPSDDQDADAIDPLRPSIGNKPNTDDNQTDVLDPSTQDPSSTQPEPGNEPVTPPPTTDGGAWKGLLMTGDNSINAFDNARKKLKSIWSEMGVNASDLRELSMRSSEQQGGVLPTSRQNIQQSLSSLNLAPTDKCIVFMTSHGSRQGFYLVNQSTLSPTELDSMLTAACGDRPTVVLVSACYSGVFIQSQAMQKPNRIILTAARPDRTSFGCGAENQYTYWDNCLIDHFKQAATWNQLYDRVAACISQKESGGGFTPSEPQAFFGASMQTYPILGPP